MPASVSTTCTIEVAPDTPSLAGDHLERFSFSPSRDEFVSRVGLIDSSYPEKSTANVPNEPAAIKEIATRCLSDLEEIFHHAAYDRLSDLMLRRSWWRDHLVLSWDFHTFSTSSSIISFLNSLGHRKMISSLSLERDPVITNLDPAETIKCIQSFLRLETPTGIGRGMLRLVQDPRDGDRWKICTLYTALVEIKGHPERINDSRPMFGVPSRSSAETRNWKDFRLEQQECVIDGPTVLIVGGGHCGLASAARLEVLGVKALVIDKNARTGDGWRERYHHLVLHDPVWMCSMPYLAFPPNWPIYASKDKVADWLEFYASIMELNVWNSTVLRESIWDSEKQSWKVVLERNQLGQRSIVTIYPRHIIQATGLSGEPYIPPNIPGFSTFEGVIMHSSEFSGASESAAEKKIAVIGACNSAHDIAQDYERNGAEVTMVQRSSTYVVTLESTRFMSKNYKENGPRLADADLDAFSIPMELKKQIASDMVKIVEQRDKAILDGYRRAGFKYGRGMANAGIAVNVFERSGGYYIDTGFGKLIGEGKIKIQQGHEIARINDRSLTLDDGTELVVDEIIFATGYSDVRVRTRRIFGDSVADSVGPIWGLDSEGEVQGVWRPTGHPGFWVAAGSFNYCRYNSQLLALQIKAAEVERVEKGIA